MESLYNKMLALDENGEFLSLLFPEPAEKPSVVVVNITTTCNLRCKYFFVECEPGKGEPMQKNVMEAVIKNMLSMPSENITFELQGGDPLNYIEDFYNFVNLLQELNKNSRKIIKIRTMTNAINATKEFAAFCKKHQITVGVSLDGPEALHNIARVDKNGAGRFHKTKACIDLLQAEGVVVDGAVCTIGKHNINAGKDLLDFFDRQFKFEVRKDAQKRPR
jgi:uncharacterized protein